jgi:hypothetical protein
LRYTNFSGVSVGFYENCCGLHACDVVRVS